MNKFERVKFFSRVIIFYSYIIFGSGDGFAFDSFQCTPIDMGQKTYYSFDSKSNPQCVLKSSQKLAGLRKQAWLEFFKSAHQVHVPDPSSCAQRLKSEKDEFVALLAEDMDEAISEKSLTQMNLENFSEHIGQMYEELEAYRQKEMERKAEFSRPGWRDRLKKAASKIAQATLLSGPQGVAGKMIAKTVLSAVSGGYSGIRNLYQKYFRRPDSKQQIAQIPGESDSVIKAQDEGKFAQEPLAAQKGRASLQIHLKELIPNNSYKVAYIRAATGVAMVGLGAVGVAASVAIPGVGGLPFVLASAGVDVAARYLETQLPDDGRRLAHLRSRIENSHSSLREGELHETAYEILREGGDQGIEIGTEKAIEHALEKSAHHGAENSISSSHEVVAESTSHGATAGFMHAIPVIGSSYSITRGLKKGYQAWKGLEPSYQEARIQEEVYQAIVQAELDRKKNNLRSNLLAAEGLSEFYGDSPSQKLQFIKRSHCLCQAIDWLDQVSSEAGAQFDVRLKYIDKKIEQQTKISNFSDSVKGVFGISRKKEQEKQLKALQGQLLQSQSNLLADQKELVESLNYFTSRPEQVLRAFNKAYPQSQEKRKDSSLGNLVEGLHSNVLRIRQQNLFLADYLKNQLARVATPRTPGATVVSFSMTPAQLGSHHDGTLALKSFTQAVQEQHEQLRNVHEDQMGQIRSMITQISRGMRK